MTALEESPVPFSNETNNLASAGDGDCARSRLRSSPWLLSSDAVDVEIPEDKTVADPVTTTELLYVREDDFDAAGEMDDEASSIREISSRGQEVETDEAVSDLGFRVLESQDISYDMTGEKLNCLEGDEMGRMELPEPSCVSEAGNDSERKDKLFKLFAFGDDSQDTREKTLNNDGININSTNHESSFDVPRLGRHCYSRIQLESLRYVDLGEQQRRWKEMYQELGSVVTREYDNVVVPNNHKQVGRNNDRRLRLDKKKDNIKFHADSLEESIGKNLDIPYPSKVAYGDNDCSGKCKFVEQPCYEDDDSDEEYDSIQSPAFLVDGEPNFESGPPQDGLEYLRRVRWEAAQIPKVKVAELDISNCSCNQTPYMPKIPDIPKCPGNLSPLKHWEDAFIADFSKLRQVFSNLENSSIESPVTSVDEDLCEQSDRLQNSKNTTPTLRTIQGLDSVSRAAMLRKHISTFESSASEELSWDICQWLFALCVAVDTPLNADMSSSLRCLLRKCSNLLAGKSKQDDDEVAMLNILVAISGKFFGQSEN